ncbi:MAG: YitT family protein [Oscillospiraceae bacterium]|nr:YitT family protein [Oscillospiraceae bacterium]MDY4586051.1 YitT family protein [Oscillospiraceae bacterium]
MKNKSVLLKKYFIVILSQIIVGIGASFLVTSGMGNDPMGVMVSGLSQKFGVMFGTMSNIVNFIIFLILLIFYRKRITLTTLITVFVPGWSINRMLELWSVVNLPSAVIKFIFPLMGCLIISAGVALCLCLDFGAGIMDNLILMIGDIFNKTYAFGCYICYAVFFTVGLLLGGVWGYATVVALVLNGKVIDFLIPKFKNTVAVWAEKA